MALSEGRQISGSVFLEAVVYSGWLHRTVLALVTVNASNERYGGSRVANVAGRETVSGVAPNIDKYLF